jgi:hypothetical protein
MVEKIVVVTSVVLMAVKLVVTMAENMVGLTVY